jgi:hypothetical protein
MRVRALLDNPVYRLLIAQQRRARNLPATAAVVVLLAAVGLLYAYEHIELLQILSLARWLFLIAAAVVCLLAAVSIPRDPIGSSRIGGATEQLALTGLSPGAWATGHLLFAGSQLLRLLPIAVVLLAVPWLFGPLRIADLLAVLFVASIFAVSCRLVALLLLRGSGAGLVLVLLGLGLVGGGMVALTAPAAALDAWAVPLLANPLVILLPHMGMDMLAWLPGAAGDMIGGTHPWQLGGVWVNPYLVFGGLHMGFWVYTGTLIALGAARAHSAPVEPVTSAQHVHGKAPGERPRPAFTIELQIGGPPMAAGDAAMRSVRMDQEWRRFHQNRRIPWIGLAEHAVMAVHTLCFLSVLSVACKAMVRAAEQPADGMIACIWLLAAAAILASCTLFVVRQPLLPETRALQRWIERRHWLLPPALAWGSRVVGVLGLAWWYGPSGRLGTMALLVLASTALVAAALTVNAVLVTRERVSASLRMAVILVAWLLTPYVAWIWLLFPGAPSAIGNLLSASPLCFLQLLTAGGAVEITRTTLAGNPAPALEVAAAPLVYGLSVALVIGWCVWGCRQYASLLVARRAQPEAADA